MYSKLISTFRDFDYLLGLITENLDQKISKLLQNQNIKSFVDKQKAGDADNTNDTQYLKRVANMFDPTPDKKFLEYVLKNWISGNINGFEDAAVVREALKKYISFAARNTPGLEKDINKYADIGELYKTLSALQPAKKDDVYKERIQNFLKAAAEDKQKVTKIYDLPNSYHLYRVDSPPESEETGLFSKSDVCQGYWCIKRPSMSHYYPLFFLEKNGFIEIAVVPNATEIKNPYNQTQYSKEQFDAINFLFDNWEDINKKSGNKFFNPYAIRGGDFGYFIFIKKLNQNNLDFSSEQVGIEIEENKEKYNQPGKMYMPESLAKVLEFIKQNTQTYVTSKYYDTKVEVTMGALKASYNNLALNDKLKYHWFYFNTLLSCAPSANHISEYFDILKPFLPPSASTSLKALTELYRQHKDVILKVTNGATPKNVTRPEDLYYSYAYTYIFLILCNAFYFSTGVKDKNFIFEYQTPEEYENEIKKLKPLTHTYYTQTALIQFFGKTAVDYLSENIGKYSTILGDLANDIGRNQDALAVAFNNLDIYTESIGYTGGRVEDQLKTIDLKEPNKDLINSQSKEFKSVYNIPEFSIFLGDILLKQQLSFAGNSDVEQNIKQSMEGSGYTDNYKAALNSIQAYKDIITGDKDYKYPKLYKTMSKGGIKDLLSAYQEQNPIDVNNFLALNYLTNIPNADRFGVISKSFANTQEGLKTAFEKEVTGDILPNIGDLVYDKLYKDLEQIDKNEKTKFTWASVFADKRYGNVSGQIKKFYDPTDPSSLVIGNISNSLFDSEDYYKSRGKNIPFSTLEDEDYSRKEIIDSFKDNANITLYCSSLNSLKKLEEKYGEKFYPKNKSAFSRAIYFMAVLHSGSNIGNLDSKYCVNHLVEAMLNLSPQEIRLLDNLNSFAIRFGTNKHVRGVLRNNEEVQQAIYNHFIPYSQAMSLKNFYIGTSNPIKAPENIEKALKLLKNKKYSEAFGGKSKNEYKVTYTILDPNKQEYIVRIGKYTLGKDFKEGLAVDQTYNQVGDQVLSSTTYINTQNLVSLIYKLEWERIFIFVNPKSYSRSFIITGMFFNAQTKETEPIVYYRKETSPGAGQSLLYLLKTKMTVSDAIYNMREKKSNINGVEISHQTDVFTLKA